ncbi:hypothetical protein CHUAL_006057 [Chamberlinius hualienensis]
MDRVKERYVDVEPLKNEIKYNYHRHPVDFQYDSADLPFSPPSTNSGYLESGSSPLNKSKISDSDRYLRPTEFTDKEPRFFPLVQFLTSNSKSHEDVSCVKTIVSSSSSSSHPLNTQSLPVTPLSTPSQTPLTTPSQTPQSSPTITRKSFIMDTSTSSTNHNQLTSNSKWFSSGFWSTQSSQPTQASVPLNSDNLTSKFESVPSSTAEFRPLSYLQKRALIISNRDMNFLAPTSM